MWFILGACLEGGREVGLDGMLGCGVEERRGRGGERKGVLERVWEGGSRGESEGVGSLEKWIEGKDSGSKEKKKRKEKEGGKKEERHPQCTTDSQPSLSEDEQPACALRVQRLVVYTFY